MTEQCAGASEESKGVPEGIRATSVLSAKHLEQQPPGKNVVVRGNAERR